MNRKAIIVSLALLIIPIYGYSRLIGKAKLDSLLQEASRQKADTTKVNTLNSISYVYSQINPDKGIDYAKQGAQLANELHWDRGLAKAYTCAAQNYTQRASWDSALYYAGLGLELHEKLGNKRNVSIALNSIADAYSGKTDLSRALEYHFKALKIREEIKDTLLIGTTLMNIGNIYVQIGDKKGVTYAHDALKLFQQIGDSNGVAACLINVGTALHQQREYREALDYFLKALALNQELGQTLRTIVTIGNIGNTYMELREFPLALKYSFEALQMSKETGDPDGEINAEAIIGKTYLFLSQAGKEMKLPDSLASITKNTFLQKSVKYLTSSVTANAGNNLEVYYDCHFYLSEAYTATGQYQKALESFKEYSKIKDSIFSENSRLKVAHQETRRETDLKEKQIEINRLSKVASTRRTQLLLFGIGFLSLVTGVTIRTGRKQKAAREKAEKLKGDLEETLAQKNQLMEKLSESADMKSKFFANISHELRTPVTILTGMLDLMKQKNGEGVDRNKLEVAFNNSRRLQYMVEEMLDLSKLNKPETVVKYEIKEIEPLIKRMTYAFSSYIEQANLSLSFEALSLDHVFVTTEEEKLEKIITNLIYNAVKFTRENGSIKVTASLSGDKQWVNISVSDTGIGISEKDLPHIFDRYYQSESSGRKDMGAGIGLSLVQELTNLLGGRVEVASKVGQGTTFTLHFPVFGEPIPETIAETELIHVPQTDLHFANNYTVLLVEDNPEMRYYIKETLSGNINLAEAGNGKLALEWLKNNHADMVITDIMMPEMDGRELITALKTEEKLKKIPIITVSALADKENQLTTLRLGIDDYIIKPFNPTELRIRVRNLLLNLEERNAFDQQPPEPDDVPADSVKAAEFKQKIQDYVLARIKNYDVTVYDLAYEFSLSERQLYRLSKSLTGFTAAQLIKEVKLQKAYEMLVNRQVAKVETVAREVGFENASYFTKQFTERFGKRPTEFL